MELIRLTQDEFDRFRSFIYDATGIRMADGKITLLSNRIRRRLRSLGVESFEEYYRQLVCGSLPGELEHFIDAITTNETHFFRTDQHFEWFRESFLPERMARSSPHERTLRVWSAACSSGEELYTLAMVIHEATGRLAGGRVSLLGTDINESMLAAARRGVFPERSLEQVPDDQRRRYFSREAGGEWAIDQRLVGMCEFRRHNLLEPFSGPKQDCIFVRNVFIYFDRQSKERAVANLIDALAPGGSLVVGPSDGVYELLGDLVKKSIFLYEKPS